MDQENYNWWLYVFMAAAPNEVIGGKNWNCVGGSQEACILIMGCVCLEIDIYKCSLSF